MRYARVRFTYTIATAADPGQGASSPASDSHQADTDTHRTPSLKEAGFAGTP